MLKFADKHEPKGVQWDALVYAGGTWTKTLPADRRHLTYTVDYVERVKPALSPGNRKADRKESRWKRG